MVLALAGDSTITRALSFPRRGGASFLTGAPSAALPAALFLTVVAAALPALPFVGVGVGGAVGAAVLPLAWVFAGARAVPFTALAALVLPGALAAGLVSA